MEKVMFLDIDGVLNSDLFYCTKYAYIKGRTSDSSRFYPEGTGEESYIMNIDRTAVGLVNKICEETGCKVVLSSCWRSAPDVIENLRCFGLDVSDTTPYHESRIRGTEIQMYLDKHDVDRYVILDDDCDMLDNQMEFLVQVDFRVGLTEEYAERAIKILNGLC